MTFDSIHDDEHLYFITASIIEWQPVFQSPSFVEVILDALATRRRQSHIFLFAYVIMPTHLHTIIKPVDWTIGKFLQNFGSYTAHRILCLLEKENRTHFLELFHQNKRDTKVNYSIWQDIQAKNIYSNDFLEQKLAYIHSNPVMKKWNLCERAEEYPYSSAGYYDTGVHGLIEVDDIREYLSPPA